MYVIVTVVSLAVLPSVKIGLYSISPTFFGASLSIFVTSYETLPVFPAKSLNLKLKLPFSLLSTQYLRLFPSSHWYTFDEGRFVITTSSSVSNVKITGPFVGTLGSAVTTPVGAFLSIVKLITCSTLVFPTKSLTFTVSFITVSDFFAPVNVLVICVLFDPSTIVHSLSSPNLIASLYVIVTVVLLRMDYIRFLL